MTSIGSPSLWFAFAAVVAVMLAVDLVAGGRGAHRVTLREAAGWSAVWVAVALAFAATLWWYVDATAGRAAANDTALKFLTGYLIEKSLAVDNVFVWLTLFSFFAIPLELQKRVLVWGVLGAIAMRTVMIFAGVWLIEQFHWLLYVFGAFLLFTGLKMAWLADKVPNLDRNPLVVWLRRHLRMTPGLHGEAFFVRREEGGRTLRYATPLLVVLVLVEASDLVFAVDSIPAIFAITTDPFLVLTSNVFAILGLRAMYFLLADMADRFTYLKYGLAVVLVLIGAKMLLIDVWKVPVALSLGAVFGVIAASIVLSLWRERHARRALVSGTPTRA